MSDTTAQRRAREQADRRARILDAARALAEADGWEKVTTRRLAEAIEYSQPVLYGHFPGGKPEIVSAVALQGFRELSALLGPAVDRPNRRERISALALAYLEFAAHHPATYEAMFGLPIEAAFGPGTPQVELAEAFSRISALLPGPEAETAAELLWSSLHGLATLDRAGRLRPTARADRLDRLIDLWSRRVR